MLDFARPSNGNFHKLYKLLETHMTYQLLDVRELSNPLGNLRGKKGKVIITSSWMLFLFFSFILVASRFFLGVATAAMKAKPGLDHRQSGPG